MNQIYEIDIFTQVKTNYKLQKNVTRGAQYVYKYPIFSDGTNWEQDTTRK